MNSIHHKEFWDHIFISYETTDHMEELAIHFLFMYLGLSAGTFKLGS